MELLVCEKCNDIYGCRDGKEVKRCDECHEIYNSRGCSAIVEAKKQVVHGVCPFCSGENQGL